MPKPHPLASIALVGATLLATLFVLELAVRVALPQDLAGGA
jgi:hypothetical protein